jgi:hypothetical protein
MTSFDVAIEPAASPRLAALALAVHATAALAPWIARMPAAQALLLSLAALAGAGSSICALPGHHHRLAALALDGRGCRVRMRGSEEWIAAELGPRCRAFAELALLDLRAGGRRLAWLLPRYAAPAGPFRRLKARIRLAC